MLQRKNCIYFNDQNQWSPGDGVRIDIDCIWAHKNFFRDN